MEPLKTWSGRCRCGKLRLRFETGLAFEQLIPRACDCDFCQQRGAAYVSDPHGRLVIEADEQDSLHFVRQGSETAEFVLCGDCGDVLAVVFDDDNIRYGSLNANCLAERASLPTAQAASPKLLATDEKKRRWRRLWVPAVAIRVGTAA